MTPQEIENHLEASGPGRSMEDLTPAEVAEARANWAAMAKTILAERVYETAAAFKAADEDASVATFARAERWADYMNALRAHATHFVHEYINTMGAHK